MVTEQTALVVNRLTLAVSSGLVWNTDFEESKYRLSGTFEKACDALRNELCNRGDGSGYSRTDHKDFPGIGDLYDILPHGLYSVKAFEKKFRSKSGVRAMPGDIAATVEDLLRDWLPIYDLLYVQAKPLIKKGRKPSETPALTDPRTLEHTGTCSVCGQNVKLSDSERIVKHGYQVEGGQFWNTCPGTGYEAWEVSRKGAEAYLRAVEARKESVEAAIGRFERGEVVEVYSQVYRKSLLKGDPQFKAAHDNKLEDLRRELSGLTYTEKRFNEKIIAWLPATLPGIRAGFTR